MFAERMNHIESSGIRKLFELSAQMKNPVDLSLGQPDFDVPDSVKEAAIEAIRLGKNRYTPTAGIPELRSALAQKLRGESIASGDCVMVTSGASGGLVLALMTLADQNTDVYLPDPYFVAYPQMIRLAEAHAVMIPTDPDFRLTSEKLKNAVALREAENRKAGVSRRKVLLFNTPGNPTGISYTEAEIQALANTTRALGIQVIADEVYDIFCYDHPHVSWLKYDSSAVLVRAFSKTGGMPGWRIGYAVAPEAILQQMLKLQQFSFVCVNTPGQWGCLKLLEIDFSKMIEEYRQRRDFLCSEMKGHFDLVRPTGSFFAFPAYRGNGELFMKKCLKKEILVVPGNVFSSRNSNFRISFSASETLLKKGITLLKEVASELG